jgi:arylsulfatase A-like enzyme
LGAGKRFQAFVQPPDLFPTILDFAGLPAPGAAWSFAARRWDVSAGVAAAPGERGIMHGTSLLPLLRGDEPDSVDPEVNPTRAYAYSGLHRQAWSVRSRTWSLLLHERAARRGARGARELFDRQHDLREQHDLAAREPAIADELELRLRRFVANLPAA